MSKYLHNFFTQFIIFFQLIWFVKLVNVLKTFAIEMLISDHEEDVLFHGTWTHRG